MNFYENNKLKKFPKDDKQDLLNDAVVKLKTQDSRADSQAMKVEEESLPSCTVPLIPLRLVISRMSFLSIGTLCKTIHMWKMLLLRNQTLLLSYF